MENTERPSLVIPNETNDSNAFVKVNEPRLLNPKKHFNGSSKCKLVKKKIHFDRGTNERWNWYSVFIWSENWWNIP